MKKSDKTRSKVAKKKTRAVKQARELKPSITFVGGKWYNEHGKEVPKPQKPPQPGPGVAEIMQFQRDVQQAQAQAQPLQRYERGKIARDDGCTCAKPENTGHVPGCKLFADALFACEKANRKTIESLAALANSTIADLEHRRIDYSRVPECWDLVPTDTPRRRCWRCPYWARHVNETPFDHQKRVGLADTPPALFEDDDDLPF